jgi:hypothetical protein
LPIDRSDRSPSLPSQELTWLRKLLILQGCLLALAFSILNLAGEVRRTIAGHLALPFP